MLFARSQFLLAIFAIAVVCASPTKADPTITLMVNGASQSLQGTPDPIGDIFSFHFIAGNGDWSIAGDAFFAEDLLGAAFIDYGFAAKSANNSSTEFSLTFSTPYSGPFNTVKSQFAGKLDDLESNNAQVTTGTRPPILPFIHNPQVDGSFLDAAGIGTGCTASGASNDDCPGTLTNHLSIATGPSGTLNVTVAFVLSADDMYRPGGSVELSGSLIPEPRTDLLLFAGMVMVIGVIARRRVH